MDDTIKIRLLKEQRERIERAAKLVTRGRGAENVSGWIREVLLQAAKEVLGEDDVE